MSNVDPLIWISLFALAAIPVGLGLAHLSSRRLERKFGRREG